MFTKEIFGIFDKTEFDPESALIRKEIIIKLNSALKRLTPNEARAIILHVVEGKTFQQIGDELGFSPQRARQLKIKGLNKLKRFG